MHYAKPIEGEAADSRIKRYLQAERQAGTLLRDQGIKVARRIAAGITKGGYNYHWWTAYDKDGNEIHLKVRVSWGPKRVVDKVNDADCTCIFFTFDESIKGLPRGLRDSACFSNHWLIKRQPDQRTGLEVQVLFVTLANEIIAEIAKESTSTEKVEISIANEPVGVA